MIAIQTTTGEDRFVTENLAFEPQGAYRYADIDEAVLFINVNAAVKWIERTSFYNGQNDKTYSGGPRLVRIDLAPVISAPERTVVGPVE